MGAYRKVTMPLLFQILLLVLLGLLIALFGAPVAVWLAKKIGAIDMPDSASHKRHRVPMPLAGGFIAFAGSCLLFLLILFWQYTPSFWAILLGGAVIFVFGVIDDVYGLSAPLKFLGQFLASALFIRFGIAVYFLETLDLNLPIFWLRLGNYFLSFFWLIGITNAFNLIDSMDGLVAGLTFIIASFFTFITFAAGQTGLSLFSSILIGISLGLYWHNRHPAHFFLGDSGSQFFGFFLAAVAVFYRPPDLNPESTWFTPILLLGVPIFDTSLVVISRVRRRKPIFQADRSHTYHRLVAFGLRPNIAVLVIQASALTLSFAAFVIMYLPPSVAIILFAIILTLGACSIILFERKTLRD